MNSLQINQNSFPINPIQLFFSIRVYLYNDCKLFVFFTIIVKTKMNIIKSFHKTTRSSDDPFAARNKRNNLGCNKAANECAYRNTRYGGNCRQWHDRLEHRNPQAEPKDMHQIHTIAEFRYFHYEPWSFRKLYTAEHQECARREKHTVDRAERPSYFQYGRGKDLSGYGLYIE